MSDEFAPPEALPPSRAPRLILGSLCFAVAGVSALCFVGGLLQDAVWLPTMLQTQTGPVLVGSAIGIAIRSAVFGGMAVGAYALGRMVISPETHGAAVVDATALRRLYDSEGLSSVPVGDVGPYGSSTDAELLDVFQQIDRNRHPERFQQLLSAIRARVEAARPDPTTVDQPPSTGDVP